MSRTNTALIAFICLLVGAGGYWLYQDRQRGGVDISVGRQGISIEPR
jgi:hypothetical protein